MSLPCSLAPMGCPSGPTEVDQVSGSCLANFVTQQKMKQEPRMHTLKHLGNEGVGKRCRNAGALPGEGSECLRVIRRVFRLTLK